MPRFHVTATYATPNGNIGCWHAEIEATWETVFAVAETALRKRRGRYVAGKLAMDAVEIRN